MQPGQVPDDQISPVTQVGGTMSPRSASTTKKSKKNKLASDDQNITPVPHAPTGSTRKKRGGGENGTSTPANGDSAPPTKSSKTRRKRGKNAGAVDFNDSEAGVPNPLAKPSEFEELKRKFEQADANNGAGAAPAGGPASGEQSAEQSESDEDNDEDSVLHTLNRSALDHPHVLLIPIVMVPILLLIIICGLELKETNSLYQKADSHDSSDLVILVQKFSDALAQEIWAAGQLQLFSTINANGGTLKTSPPVNHHNFAGARFDYTETIGRTTQQLSNLLLLYTTQSDEIEDRTGGSKLSPDGLSIAHLERLRDSVLKGQHLDVTLNQYHRLQKKVLLFVARAHLRRIALQKSGLDALRLLCLKQQGASLKLLSRLIAGARISKDTVQMTTFAELQLAWKLIGQYEVCLYSLAAPGLDGSFDLTNIQIPADHADVAMTSLISSNVGVAGAFSWNASAATELRGLQKQRAATSATERLDLLHRVSEKPQAPTMRGLLAVSIVSILVAFFAMIFNGVGAASYAVDLRQQQAFNKDVRSLERCINRIKVFVNHIQMLDISWMSRYAKRLGGKNVKIRTQQEENIMYQSTAHLKDVATYLPPTVTSAPRDLPKALLTKTGLFIKPHLVPSRDLIGVRTSLNGFHGQFGAGGSKQKGMQHQMTRFLNLLQELGAKENENAFVNVFGDHALLWLNVIDAMDFPCVAAFRVVVSLLNEVAQGGVATPNVVICAGDGLCGHVGNSATNHLDVVNAGYPLTTSFTVFGPVADELYLLDSVCQLHEVDFVANDKVTKGFFNEKHVIKNDVFASHDVGVDGVADGESKLTFSPIELSRFPPSAILHQNSTNGDDGATNGNGTNGNGEDVSYSPTYEFNAESCDIHDYTALLNDNFFIAPAFRVMNNVPSEDSKRMSEWVSIFDHFFDAVKNPNTANINVAMERLDQYTTTYGTNPTSLRLMRVLKEGSGGKRMGADLIGIKTDRLYAGIA